LNTGIEVQNLKPNSKDHKNSSGNSSCSSPPPPNHKGENLIDGDNAKRMFTEFDDERANFFDVDFTNG
jgi:hypothetical protein